MFPVSEPFIVKKSEFMQYFMTVLTFQHRQTSLCFFMPEIVNFVNKVNERLFYESILQNLDQKDKKVDEY